MGIKAVVFDVGGVVLDWKAEDGYIDLIPDLGERQYFLDHICNAAWRLKQDAGQGLHEGMEELAATHPTYEGMIRQFYHRWPLMLRGVLPGGLALLDELLDNEIPVYALTNWSAETWPYAVSKHPFLQRFRKVVVSGEVKLAKPDAAIYQLMHEEVRHDLPSIQPDEIAFIDDTLVNVIAGEHFGWKAIHHTDPTQTRTALRLAGLPLR